MTRARLLLGALIDALDGLDLDGTVGVVQHGVEEGMDYLVLECRPREDR